MQKGDIIIGINGPRTINNIKMNSEYQNVAILDNNLELTTSEIRQIFLPKALFDECFGNAEYSYKVHQDTIVRMQTITLAFAGTLVSFVRVDRIDKFRNLDVITYRECTPISTLLKNLKWGRWSFELDSLAHIIVPPGFDNKNFANYNDAHASVSKFIQNSKFKKDEQVHSESIAICRESKSTTSSTGLGRDLSPDPSGQTCYSEGDDQFPITIGGRKISGIVILGLE